jgi:hypothetical protein
MSREAPVRPAGPRRAGAKARRVADGTIDADKGQQQRRSGKQSQHNRPHAIRRVGGVDPTIERHGLVYGAQRLELLHARTDGRVRGVLT